MHGTTMVFLAVMPLSAAFFNYLIPLMIGARDVAFPRLNAFSYWMYLFGGIFINMSWFLGGAPDAGWFGYANLTSTTYTPGSRVDYWGLGLQILGHRHAGVGLQLHRDHPEHAGARHDADAHARVRLDHAGHLVSHHLLVPVDDGGASPAHLRPAVRHQLL